MRITFLSSNPAPWGGSEEMWWAAACALHRAGHSVQILKEGVAREHPRIKALPCPIHDIGGTRETSTGQRVQLARAALHLVRPRPDLAVISQGQNYDGARLARLCQRLRVPYVLISQKASDLDWPGDNMREYIRAAFERARVAVFVAEHNRRLTEEQLGVRLRNARVVPNPVLAGSGTPLPWPAGEELRLACLARLYVAEKGQDVLLRALADLRWRDRPLHVTFYGEGGDAHGLAEMAALLGVERVTFAGHTSDVEAVWRDHHALVLASRDEGLPLTLLEAMACGRPAIVTDVGGCAALVEDGVSGFVAAYPTPSALNDALERAWARRADWPEMGRAALGRVDRGGVQALVELLEETQA